MEELRVDFIAAKTDEEIERLAHLASEIWHECFSRLLKPEQIDYMVDKFQSAPALARQIGSEGYEYFVLQVEGAPAGYVGIQAKDHKLLLSKLYLKASFRGKGLGGQMLDFVQQAGRERECEAVWLTVNRDNERAISVYRRTGFTKVREQVVDIGGGFVMDDFVFEKPL